MTLSHDISTINIVLTLLLLGLIIIIIIIIITFFTHCQWRLRTF